MVSYNALLRTSEHRTSNRELKGEALSKLFGGSHEPPKPRPNGRGKPNHIYVRIWFSCVYVWVYPLTNLLLHQYNILEHLEEIRMEHMELKRDSPHSVEFSITSKGLWSGKVKAYATSPKAALGEALIIAEKVNTICKAKNTIGVEKNGKL